MILELLVATVGFANSGIDEARGMEREFATDARFDASPPNPPDRNKIYVEKSITGVAVVGTDHAVDAGATVTVTDANGSQRTTTANSSGAFVLSIGGLAAQNCTYLLVTQTTSAGTSNAVAIHSDPPMEDFATPDWEAIYARYLASGKVADAVRDGRRVLVRPRLEAIVVEPREAAAPSEVVGRRGAVDGRSCVVVATAGGSISCVMAGPSGDFAPVTSAVRDEILVSHRSGGRASRATPVAAGTERR